MNENGEPKSGNTVPDDGSDRVTESEDEDEEPTIFEKIFLDYEYNIKEAVHKKLESFPWLCGAYGITGPNENIPHPHLYVTIKNGMKKFDVLDDIKAAFECEPNEYFELLDEPKRELRLTYLSKPSSGGGIVAVSKDKQISPRRSSGTLTMFCSPNDEHYALTCFHVACATHEKQDHDQIFNLSLFHEIHSSIEGWQNYAKEQNEYCYNNEETRNNNPGDDTHLGEFYDCSFNTESDIMAIKVRKDVEIECKVEGSATPDWKKIARKLIKKVLTNEKVFVQKKIGYSSNPSVGSIVQMNFSYKSIFKNAILIENGSDDPKKEFITGGDSGALIHFWDKKGRKQAFAYCVCTIDNFDPEGNSPDENLYAGTTSRNERVSTSGKRWEPKKDEFITFLKTGKNGSFHVGLRLDTALKNLGLSDAGCFEKCAGAQ